ncbi:MAG: hypothetical protein RBT33_01340 [Candidatus Dojkabacteria bacterium]|jgi:hypothetical protein|nr:hypothetical protein [Candidatus Dojkabacteria bacterium]
MDNSILLTVTIVVLIVLLVIMARYNSKRVPVEKKSKILKKLDDLREQSESDEMYARRDAIIKLDNLLSKSLQIRYSNESSCGDNLKNAKTLFRKDYYQDIWDVHKLRNEIVHKDADVSYDSAQQAYKIYKMAITKILK